MKPYERNLAGAVVLALFSVYLFTQGDSFPAAFNAATAVIMFVLWRARRPHP